MQSDSRGNQTFVRGAMKPLGYAQYLNVTNATAINLANTPNNGVVVPLAITTSNPARIAIIQTEGQAIRYRDDGTAPTATVGMPLATGTVLSYEGDLSTIQLIAQANNANISVLYYGQLTTYKNICTNRIKLVSTY